jgi:hypothetical protein
MFYINVKTSLTVKSSFEARLRSLMKLVVTENVMIIYIVDWCPSHRGFSN